MSSVDVHRQHYNVTFALLALGAIAYALMQSMVAPALLTIQHDLNTTTAGAAWILSAYLISASVITPIRSEEHTSELQSRGHLVCRLLLEKKNIEKHFSDPTARD